MALLNFGGFQLDVDARRIYSTDGELAVEPKVIEVLCYLIQHRDRLVPLTELHAEVWSGRVVTDTAVRRTISKLRALLGDTDPDAPLYIKSQMKRGYQFIGEALPEQISIADADVIRHEVVSTRAAAYPNLSNQSVSAPKASRKRWYWLAAAMVLICAVLALTFLPFAPKNQSLTTKPLVSVAGEKAFLSVSPNGRYHAFTGRLKKIEGWQPYVYDRQLGHLQKIKLPDGVTFPILSMLDNETLFVSAMKGDDAWLLIYAMANLNKPVKIIKPKDFSGIGPAVSYQGQVVLVNGKKKNEESAAYYLLNLDTAAFSQFTFSSSPDSQDHYLVVSPDKKHFAFIRKDAGYKIQVYRVVDHTLLREYVIANTQLIMGDELHLVWLDNHRLLINAADNTKQLNIVSGLATDVTGTNRFSALDRDASGQLFGLLKQPQTTTFYQFQWSQPDFAQRYFTFEKPPHRLDFSRTPDHLWLVEEHQNSYQLNHYQPDTGDKKTYYSANYSFRVTAESLQTSELLLWSSQKQLQLLERTTGQVTQIASIDQAVVFASFAADGKDIYFSEKIGEQWQVNVFDRKTMTQRILVKGYRVFLPWQQQFIAANDQGQFFVLDSDFQVVKPLQLKLDFRVRYQLSLQGNHLLAANIDYANTNWRFYELDLITEQYQEYPATTLPIKTRISFSYNGKAAMAIVDNHLDSELVELNVDAN
jgi:DNA-binding winged helix-turn-helix (wHTH) protein